MSLKLYTTCPQSKEYAATEYLDRVRTVSQWSDAGGCTGMLIYSDNSIVDPWLVAQAIIASTRALSPLVAVQPVYLHPYAVAKMVASLTVLHGRRLSLNMIAGGFRGDLIALGDPTEHNARYDRLVEYTTIIQTLLRGDKATVEGRYYTTRGLRLSINVEPAMLPEYLTSGSSPAAQAAALAIGATSVEYPAPPNRLFLTASCKPRGIRVGIIARETAEAAWQEAWQRFPEDRRGQLAHNLAMKVSDSAWHKQLSQLARPTADANQPYWLWPFQSYQTFCPYFVGDYATVAGELACYLRHGYSTFILDIPRGPIDVETANMVLSHAAEIARLDG